MKDLAPQLLEEAAGWQARLTAPDCTEFDRARFERWRAGDAGHAQAAAAVEQLEADIEALAASDPRLLALAGEMEPGTQRRWFVPAAAAATVLMAVAALFFWKQTPLPNPEPLTFATAAGEQASVTLRDGSRVHLDVSSTLEVSITNRERSILLHKGRALFDVASDPRRPFSVQAGNGSIVALGTRFQVQKGAERVTVVLTEGLVAVSAHAGEGGPEHRDRLQPGEQLTYSADSSYWVKRKVDTDAATSWTRRRLVFRGTPLEDVIDEVNRYTERKLRLAEPELETLEVSGTFAIADSATVAQALSALLPVHVRDTGTGEIVIER